MPEITSRTNEKVKELFKLLNDSNERTKLQVAVLEGKKLVFEALERDFSFHSLWIDKTKYNNITLDNNKISSDNIYIASSHVMDKLSSQKTSQGIVGVIYTNNVKEQRNVSRALLLCGVQDPVNIGASIRTAVAFGFDDIMISKGSADPFSPKAIRGSMGAVLRCNLMYNIDASQIIQQYKQNGYRCFATALEQQSIDISELKNDPKEKILIVIGNEGNGLPIDVINLCDNTIKIGIIGDIESLNASVAAGITMYHLRKQ